MAEKFEYPKVVLKRKNIQTLVDFLLDEGIEFTVKQQTFPDTDWEVEMRISEIKVAILVGMFLRENKMELAGVDSSKLKKAAPAKKTASSSSSAGSNNDEAEAEETETKENTLGF